MSLIQLRWNETYTTFFLCKLCGFAWFNTHQIDMKEWRKKMVRNESWDERKFDQGRTTSKKTRKIDAEKSMKNNLNAWNVERMKFPVYRSFKFLFIAAELVFFSLYFKMG